MTLTWAPPTLSSPLEVDVTGGVIQLAADQDCVLRLGKLAAPGGLQVVGGRNVVLIGGEIMLPASAVPNPPNYENLRAGLFKGQTGTVHVEGVRVYAEPGGFVDEGFDFIAPSAVAQLQNIRIEHLRQYAPGSVSEHPDLIQPYGGLAELRVDGLTGSTAYQGITLKNDLGKIGKVTLRRVNIVGESADYRQMLWQHTADIPIELADFYIQPPSFQKLLGSVWPNQSGTYPRQSFMQPDGTVAWPPASNIKGCVRLGPPTGGDFVPAGSVGLNYSTPGYG